jgi:D-lyxose ketol-isomerase
MDSETKADLNAILGRATAMIETAGFVLTEAERRSLAVDDFGLGNIAAEGFVFTDLFRSAKVRFTLFVLLPGQSLPEHYHPSYDGETGKEETLRVLHGETRINIPGTVNNDEMHIPSGKSDFYKTRHEVRLTQGEQYTLDPPIPHWFQGGPEGSVNITIQNRVDETRNVFTDPDSTGCPIKLTD